ncbi:hypothetical protein BC833DRAFT_462844, partial [Globomyces pollinis-pini]
MDKLKILGRMKRIGMRWEDLLYVLGIDESEVDDVLETIKEISLKKDSSHAEMQLLKLPLEILIKTTEYLESSDALILSSCSKQFLPLRKFIVGNRRKLVLTSKVEYIPQFITEYTQRVHINAGKDENMVKIHCKLLETCSDIRHIVINYNKDLDIGLLSKFTHIQALHLNTSGIKDMSLLSNFQSLRDLSIRRWPADVESNPLDISVLSTLPHLRKLSILYTSVVNTAPLSTLIHLEDLALSQTNVSDISGLSPLVNLVNLSLYINALSDIKALQSMKKLKTLHLFSTEVPLDTRPLVHLTNLVELTADGCHIIDISFLSSLPRLTSLSLEDNLISDLKPLQSLTNLENLHMSRNRIQDVSVLSHLPKLKKLYLDENEIEDISCFHLLDQLEEVNL